MKLAPLMKLPAPRALPAALARGTWHDLNGAPGKGSAILTHWRAAHGPEMQRRRASIAGRRSFAGASIGRTTADWTSASTSADSEIYTSLRTLRNRSRQLVRDNEYAKNAIDRIIPNNVIGTGVRFQAQVMMRRGGKLDEKINSAIEAEWGVWTADDSCHVAGKLSFQDIERMVARTTPEAGEILVRMIKGKRFGRSKVPFALEIIEADQLVDTFSGRTENGNEVRMGVEVDQWQRPIAYWLYPRHPGDFLFTATAPSNTWQRVPADEVLHVALFDRPLQTRGVPWLHAAMLKLRHIGGYEEAEIVRARASASVMGFIQSPDSDAGAPGMNDPMGSDDVVDGEKVFDMAPGIIKELAPGETFEGFTPNTANAAMEGFMRFMLRGFAVGTGISYPSISGDYSQSNYSSSRLALLDDRDNWRVLQAWLIRRFHQKVYEAWLEMAVLSGALSLPAYEIAPEIYQAVKWSARGWDWIDPVKEVAAAKAAVRAGFTTQTDVIAAKGGDIEELLKQRTREVDMAADAGLVFDTDPAEVNDKGAVQTSAAGEGAGLDQDGNAVQGGGPDDVGSQPAEAAGAAQE